MDFDVFELAHKVSIVETIRHYIPLQYKGGKYYGLCPFHEDKTMGSFVVFPDTSSQKRGWFQCYACSVRGDNIDFVRQYLKIGYRDAAITIAENAKLISPSDADALRRNCKPSSVDIAAVQRKPEQEQKKLILAEKRGAEHLDRVYRCFAAAANPLTPRIKETLLSSRKIPEHRLASYFLFPTKYELPMFWNRFYKKIAEEFGTASPLEIDRLLIGVPGFYVRNQDKKVAFSTSKERRIGIMIFDRKGRVSGIQTRAAGSLSGGFHSKQEKSTRYKFLSSGYANGTQESFGTLGCSCGFIEDILFPCGGWNRAVAVTEGRFKAESLAALGFLVVNMHGISNWKAAGHTAIELANATHARQFVLCYDREENENLVQSAASLHGLLAPVLTTEFAVWDPSFGKGIDDVINAGYIKEISRVPAEVYFTSNKAA